MKESVIDGNEEAESNVRVDMSVCTNRNGNDEQASTSPEIYTQRRTRDMATNNKVL